MAPRDGSTLEPLPLILIPTSQEDYSTSFAGAAARSITIPTSDCRTAFEMSHERLYAPVKSHSSYHSLPCFNLQKHVGDIDHFTFRPYCRQLPHHQRHSTILQSEMLSCQTVRPIALQSRMSADCPNAIKPLALRRPQYPMASSEPKSEPQNGGSTLYSG